jgi:acyl-CoA synthetase (AMP-forming)/AMP-acid ligase II
MLGNVADFVILALGLSKVGAAIVPIDPTTTSREFELVLDTVPLRALITRPRGTDGGAGASSPPAMDFGSPRKPAARAAASTPPATHGRRAHDVPESRPRLQGPLLTCSMFQRAIPALVVKPDVLERVVDVLARPQAPIAGRVLAA